MRKFFFFILFFTLFTTAAYAADGSPELASNFTLDKKDDLSGLMLSTFLSDAWQSLVGGEVAEGFASYAGLVSGLFSILNLSALVYVSAMVFYIWGMAAVTTAHEGGKFGGRGFSTIWVPIRHGAAFAMTIPVFKGLSLMQVAIVACLGLSINTANILWNYVGGHLVQRADSYAVSSFTRAARLDAYEIIPLMFQSLVIENVLRDYRIQSKRDVWAQTYKTNNSDNPDKLKTIQYPVNFEGSYDKNGEMLISKNFDSGTAIIQPRTVRGVSATVYNSIVVKIPRWECLGIYCEKPVTQDYELQKAASDAIIKNILKLCEKINDLANDYLATDSGGCAILNGGQCNDGSEFGTKIAGKTLEMSESYLSDCADDINSLISRYALNSQYKWQTQLAKTMGITNWESDKAQSRFGWVSAGLFPFSIASMSKNIENSFSINVYAADSEDGTAFIKNLEKKYAYLNSHYQMAITDAEPFIRAHMNNDSYYAAKKKLHELGGRNSDSVFNEIKEALIDKFQDASISIASGNRNMANAGILSYVLKRSEQNDPLVVLTEFGDKLLDAAETFLVVGIVSKVGGKTFSLGGKLFSFAPDSFLRTMGSTLNAVGVTAISATLAIGGLGIFFGYVVPLLPVLFWLQAIFSWFFLVIEVMVAAPFWVCAHAAVADRGFTGARARKGYLMLFDIMTRPLLMVVGVLVAIIATQIAGYLVNLMFNQWFGSQIERIGFLADVIYAIVVGSMLYYVYYQMFTTGVLYIPQRISQWCSQVSARGMNNEMDATQQIMRAGNAQQQMKQSIANIIQRR